ncbi:MAG: hypothetical protein GY861_14520 [bacterium]|nr:hypothetical protein [bacterium]
MNTMSEAINELVKALIDAQAEFDPIKKKAENPFFKSKYATLDEVIACTKAGLANNGLAVSQLPTGDSVKTLLMHTSGQWICADTDLCIEKKTPQGQGSSISYARRYGISAILNVCSEPDDDGNEAQKAAKKKAPSVAEVQKMKEELSLNEITSKMSFWEFMRDNYKSTAIEIHELNKTQLVWMYENIKKLEKEFSKYEEPVMN